MNGVLAQTGAYRGLCVLKDKLDLVGIYNIGGVLEVEVLTISPPGSHVTEPTILALWGLDPSKCI